MAYEIVSLEIADGVEALCLAVVGKPPFLEKLSCSPKTRDRAVLISRTANRIHDNGLDWAFQSETLKSIDDELSLCELRIKGRVIRVMTYIHNKQIPIYLFDFDGHQGKTGKVSSNILKKGKQLSEEARKCMESEGSEW